MKKWIKIVCVLLALILLGFIAYKFILSPSENSSKVFISEKVSRRTIQTTISSTGTLSPMDTVNVGTQVSGDISKLYVDFNSKV